MSIFLIEHFSDMLSILVIVFIFREIVTYKKITGLKYILTPLVTVLISGFIILSMHDTGITSYKVLILAGLIFSLIADTILMIERDDLLKFGIVYFLLAHIIYIIAFSRGYSFKGWNIVIALILVIFVLLFFRKIRGNTGGLDIPVLIYTIVISIMVFFAFSRINQGFSREAVFALTGAIMFMISDFIIAFNAFIKEIPHSSVIVWFFYAPAQFMIGMSCFG